MKIGLVGLGKMGANMAERIRGAGHEVVGYDRDPDVSEVASIADLVGALGDVPRVVWSMV
ncbi:MAG: NAD(P)-binding domain-containing protein, partial [Acidimicrobiales bacterium]